MYGIPSNSNSKDSKDVKLKGTAGYQ